jgi:hypothetical protein
MASTISAGTTSGTALNMAGDTTGNLAFQTQAGTYTQTMPNATGTILTTGSPQSGGVIQVVSNVYSTQTSTTATSPIVSTGQTATITPKFATSKILVICNNQIRTAAGTWGGFLLYKGGSSIYQIFSGFGYPGTNVYTSQLAFNYLDSPATTSSTTYSLYFLSATGGVAVTAQQDNYGAVMTLMEIAA